jgi:hypothetical protein
MRIKSTRHPGPFLEYFFIPYKSIKKIANTQLESLGLMPTTPSPVKIEKYCERQWGFTEDYTDLDPGILGCAGFSENGIEMIGISRELAEDDTRIGRVRTRSTLAHEIGHGELHSKPFAEKILHDKNQGDLFNDAPTKQKILCRESQIIKPSVDEWWETQVNYYMAEILLPHHLLREVVEHHMHKQIGNVFKPSNTIIEHEVADIFEVSREMARIAAGKMEQIIWNERRQLTLEG